jgi:single-strand DNA-binding protein
VNNSNLLVSIVQPPELRYLSNGTTSIAEFQVSFPLPKTPEQPAVVKAIAWGKLGEGICEQNLQVGDSLILESRVAIVETESVEGTKNKKIELNVQRYYLVSGTVAAPTASQSAPAVPQAKAQARTPVTPVAQLATPKAATVAKAAPAVNYEPDYDDIPF